LLKLTNEGMSSIIPVTSERLFLVTNNLLL